VYREVRFFMSEASKSVCTISGFKIILTDGKDIESSFLKTLKVFLASEGGSTDFTALSSSANSRVVRFALNEKSYVFKEFLSRGIFEPIKALTCGTRAEKACLGARMLEENGFSTPRIVAYGVKRFFGLLRRDFIITRFIPESIGVSAFLKERFHSLPDKDKFIAKRCIIKLIGSLLGRLHSKGIVHGDLRLDNILLIGLGEIPEISAYLIDNERNKIYKKIPRSQLVKNLVQINMIDLPFISLNDRLRCYAEYLRFYPELSFDKRAILKEVDEVTVMRLRDKFNRSYLD
jgi:tRNA A-37 threonylcarbamoyl transferase component Bud32